MHDLNGKAAVITGAASGIGLALARRLAREGVALMLADLDAGALEAAVAGLARDGARVEGQPLDVTDRAAVEGLADRAFAAFGKVHMLFNNAGVHAGGARPMEATPVNAFRWAMDVNFFGPVHGIEAFLPRMQAHGEPALISATSSISGLLYPPGLAPYASSKAALVALMETLANQLSAEGSNVRAQLLFPGPHVVDTNLFGSHRLLQAKYDDPALRAGGRVQSMDAYRAMMRRTLGREAPTTDPADFAEEVLQAVLKDEFYVLPLTDRAKAAIRKRFETMIERGPPAAPDRF
jgi:NAD(P)-dependent dehydrogenase (short-subunit alcohol dehydrogenase family)